MTERNFKIITKAVWNISKMVLPFEKRNKKNTTVEKKTVMVGGGTDVGEIR